MSFGPAGADGRPPLDQDILWSRSAVSDARCEHAWSRQAAPTGRDIVGVSPVTVPTGRDIVVRWRATWMVVSATPRMLSIQDVRGLQGIAVPAWRSTLSLRAVSSSTPRSLSIASLKTPRRHMLVELSVPYWSDVAHCPGLAQPDSRICLRVSAATSVPVPHATRSYASVGTAPGPSLHSTVSQVL